MLDSPFNPFKQKFKLIFFIKTESRMFQFLNFEYFETYLLKISQNGIVCLYLGVNKSVEVHEM